MSARMTCPLQLWPTRIVAHPCDSISKRELGDRKEAKAGRGEVLVVEVVEQADEDGSCQLRWRNFGTMIKVYRLNARYGTMADGTKPRYIAAGGSRI